MNLMMFSDLHLRAVDNFGTQTADGLNSRLVHKKEIFRRVLREALERDVDAIVDLGDTFDTINPSDRLRNFYAEMIAEVWAQCPKMRYIRVLGNHETDGKHGVGYDIELLGLQDRYMVVSKPTVLEIAGQSVLFIPEVDIVTITKAIGEAKKLPIVGHFEVQEVRYPNGMKSEQGVAKVEFAGRKYPVWLGHIHKRQTLFGGAVEYIGALFKRDFGDRNIVTGCCYVEIDGMEASTEYIDISDIDIIQLDVREDGECFEEVLNVDLPAGSIVKLSFHGTREWYSMLDERKVISELRKAGVVKIFTALTLEGGEVEIKELKGEVDFMEEVKVRAKADGRDEKVGIEFLTKALDKGVV